MFSMSNDAYRRRVHYFSLFLYGLTITTIGPMLPVIAEKFQIAQKTASLVNTFLSAGFLAGVASASYLMKKPKRSSLLSMVVMAVAGIIAFFSGNFTMMALAFAGIGASGGLIEMNSNTSMVKYGVEKTALYLNILHFYFGVGALLGPVLASWFILHGLWKSLYLVLASLAVVVGMTMTRIVCEDEDTHDVWSFLGLFKNPFYVAGGMIALLYVGFEMSYNSWLVTYLNQTGRYDIQTASMALSIFWITMTFGRIFFGYLALKASRRVILSSIILVASLAYLFFLYGSSSRAGEIPSIAVTGFFLSSIFPMLVAVMNIIGNAKGKDINTFAMIFMGMGIMIFPYLAGMAAETYDLKTAMGWLASLLVASFILSLLFLLKLKKR